jgi:hypothetical protein
MALFDWKTLMTQWNQELFVSNLQSLDAPANFIASNWLGAPGATEEQIAALESRLGVSLPPSYRQFLQFTNGWWETGSFITRIWPTEQVEWLRVRHQDDIISPWTGSVTWGERNSMPVISDSEYYRYGDNQDPITMRAEYLPFMLEISDVGDGIMLLNPRVVSKEGEWEAWFLASWLPGANRYRSFWDMMQASFRSFRRFAATEAKRVSSAEPVERAAEKLDGLIAELREKAQQFNFPAFNLGAQMDIGIDLPEDACRMMDDQMGIMQGYTRGTVNAYTEAADAIDQYRDQIKDPVTLLNKIKELALSARQQSLETQRQAQVNLMTDLSLGNLFAFQSRAGEMLYDQGYAQGQLGAAATIDWFFGK